MEFIFFVLFCVTLVFYFNLRSRVFRLEKDFSALKSGKIAISGGVVSKEPIGAIGDVPTSLISYIKEQDLRGIARNDIKNALLNNNWQLQDIEKAFDVLKVPSRVVSGDNVSLSTEENNIFNRFTEWFKEDWLLKLGALLLLIGFGWLTSYAFMNNWIGPMGRIAFGIIAGLVFVVLGWWRIKKYIHQGGIFLVLGSTVILLTVFAGREIYDFFTPISALAIMFISTAFVALASVKYSSNSLALSSLILAGIAPLLVRVSSLGDIWLFSYLFVVTLGAVWIVTMTGKRELTIAALSIFAIYSIPHFSPFNNSEMSTLLLFAYAFATLFFITNTLGIIKLREKNITYDTITAFGNGLLLLVWISVGAGDEWKSLIMSFWMVVFSVGAFAVFVITKKREPFYVYAGVGVAMLAAATAVELNGAALTIAYTIEVGLLSLISYLLLKDIKIIDKLSFLFVGPIILSLSSMDSGLWSNGFINKDFFVLLVLSVVLSALGAFFFVSVPNDEQKETKISSRFIVAGSMYIYILLWLSLHSIMSNDDTAVMISLIIYTIIGIAVYFYGLKNDNRGFRVYGAILLGFVFGRLILVDIWTMELAGRIITFFLIGALLVSTAFLGKKKKDLNLINKI